MQHGVTGDLERAASGEQCGKSLTGEVPREERRTGDRVLTTVWRSSALKESRKSRL